MIFTYNEFVTKLNNRIKADQTFINDLLITVISNPSRYTGVFRLSNAKTKLIQNVTQSIEIKFGDFMEDIMTDYIHRMGYVNLHKNIGFDREGNVLSADQIFELDNKIYLIEQKIRDDHDSTKKRGQYANFQKKYSLLKELYPNKDLIACMWFIDDSLTKNKKFYISKTMKEETIKVDKHIYYGKELFMDLFERIDVWEEIINYLSRNKSERNHELLNIPDFDTSEEVYIALQNLKILSTFSTKDITTNGYKPSVKSLYSKLLSNDDKYIQLREELFPTSFNLKRIKEFQIID